MKTMIYDMVVAGILAFPVDMLRYDSAWPATSDDALKLTKIIKETPREYDEDGKCLKTTLRLRCYGPPTPDRWRSFQWSCKVIA